VIEAVVFDLDGVLLDSEQVWDEVREALARERGGRWHERAQRDMMGMSSTEWSRYMHDVIGLREPPEEISAEVVRRMGGRYRDRLPLLPGAVEAVEPLAARWPLGLASSSNRPLIDLVLDVFLEAARRLGIAPRRCAVVEDSANGILAGRAAGMLVVAIPNPHFPPGDEALAAADVVLRSLDELVPSAFESASSRRGR